MNRLKLAVIGTGALGRHHARILSHMPDVELVAAVEPNPEIGKPVAEACRTEWLPDYNSIFERIDAAVVVVPTALHLRVAREFLSRGVHLLVEKPLASTVEQGRELVELAREHNAVLQVGHVERFNPALQVAWDHIDDPKYIRAERLSPYSFRSTDIGVTHDLMIHDLDLILSRVHSPIRRVDAFGVCLMGGREDLVQARLTFENGCVADLTASRVHPEAKRALHAWSANGCVSVDLTTKRVTQYSISPQLRYGVSPLDQSRQPGVDLALLKQQVFGEWIDVAELEVPEQDALTAELSHFLDCVRRGTTPLVDGVAGLKALELAEQIVAEVGRHQWDGHATGAIGPHLLPFAKPKRHAA
ncbi:MAG: Gfo/Idh/MocA family oxidoreductase [Planctomycetaceae bacterium]